MTVAILTCPPWCCTQSRGLRAYLISLPVDNGPALFVQIVLAAMVCAFSSFVGLVLGVVGFAK